MGRSYILIFILSICLFIQMPAVAIAQTHIPKNFSFINKKKKKIIIPFESVHNLVIIPIKINDSDTLKFILDSGVHHTLITELPEGDSLSLNYSQQIEVAGLGDGDPIPALHSQQNKVVLEGIEGHNQDIIVLLEDKFFLSTSLGLNVHGLIGYDLFKDFIIKINYIRHYIVLYDPKEYKKHRNESELEISLVRNKPYITTDVVQADGSNVKVHLLLDMGASHGCSLYPFIDSNITLPNKTVRTFLGKGLNGDINGEIGRIKNISIGKYNLNDPVVAFPDEKNARLATQLTYHHGSIGSEVLRRFHLTFDYPNAKIYFKPNKEFKKDFNFNLTGMSIVAPYPGVPIYMIDRIISNSPAEKAGLEEGDIIEKINGKYVGGFSLPEIIDMLNTRDGGKVFVAVRRDNKVYYLKLELEDQI